MNILVVLGHQQPGSLNHAIAETTVTTLKDMGHKVVFHDLYAEGFDPLITHEEIPNGGPLTPEIQQHCDELAAADGIVIVHPNWWGMPPAMLKGWVDRVMRVGVAYRFLEGDNGEGIPEGLLKAKQAVVFNTSNTPDNREHNLFGDPLENLWKTCILDFCGVKDFYRRMFNIVCISSPEERGQWLDEVEGTIRRLFPG